jgi:hypothetical protein
MAMPFGRSRIHDTEDELPESDDELIMSVLKDLGIQERPDMETERSSYLEATESAPKWCSVAFSETSDGWSIVSPSSSSQPSRRVYAQSLAMRV